MKPNPKDRNQMARDKIKKKTILIYGAPAHKSTGNSKLVRNMAMVFKLAGWNVFTIGRDYNGPQLVQDGIPIFAGFRCENCDSFDINKISQYLNKIYPTPEYFIAVGDPYQMQQDQLGNLTLDKSNIKAIAYCTIDADGLFCNERLTKNGVKDYLAICDKVVSTAKYTKEQFTKWLDLDTNMIHETIDLELYKPVSKEQKIELRKKYRFKEDDFVMYYSGRNIMRKRWHILLDASAKFICETKDTYLYLNIPTEGWREDNTPVFPDGLNPWDFVKRVLKKKYGRDLEEEKRIIFVERSGLGSTKISESDNSELYKISDIYVTTTCGEGFGLNPIESLACGVPSIVPDNTTARETIGMIGEPEDISKVGNMGFKFAKGGLLTNCPIELYVDWGLKQDITTVENTYKAIKFLYDDLDLRENLGKQGREYVSKMFNFQLFGKKWIDIINTTEKKEIKKADDGFKKMEVKEDGKTKKS